MAQARVKGDKSKPEDYNKIVDSAELLDVKLIETAFNIQAIYFVKDQEDLGFRYSCDLDTTMYDRESRKLIGRVTLEAGCKEGRKWVLRAKSTYIVAYSVTGDPVLEAAEAYLQRVGVFTAYPYFRSHFAMLCMDAGAKVPPLPVLKGNLPRRIGGSLQPAGALANAERVAAPDVGND